MSLDSISRWPDLLTAHHDAVQRIPGLGVDSAQQIIAEVGATAATFPSSKHLASGSEGALQLLGTGIPFNAAAARFECYLKTGSGRAFTKRHF